MPFALAPDGFRANTTIQVATASDWVQALRDILVNTCGWSVVSGSNPNWVLQSATSGDGLAMRLRTALSGSSVNLFVQSENSAFESQNFRLNTTLGTNVIWRVIANQYQVYVLVPGIASSNAVNTQTDGGTFFCCGTVSVPPQLVGITTRVVWANGNWTFNFGVPYEGSFRTSPVLNNRAFFWNIYNGSAYLTDGFLNNFLGKPRLNVMQGAQLDQRTSLRWVTQDFLVYAPEYCMATNGNINSETKRVGALWDACYFSDSKSVVCDQVLSFAGRNWYVIMNNDFNGVACDGALAVVVP